MEVHVNTVSSVARSIASRRGAGRVRCVEVGEFWVQEKVNKKELPSIKVRGSIKLPTA